jgi:hypothetical protein
MRGPARVNKEQNARHTENRDSRKEQRDAGADPKASFRKTYRSYSREFWLLRAQIHVESPCHMLCTFCMRANHSSCFQTQPCPNVASIADALSFVDQLDAVVVYGKVADSLLRR